MSVCIPCQNLPELHAPLFQCCPPLKSWEAKDSVEFARAGPYLFEKPRRYWVELPSFQSGCVHAELKSHGLSTVLRNSLSPAISMYSQCWGKTKDLFSVFEMINCICYRAGPPQSVPSVQPASCWRFLWLLGSRWWQQEIQVQSWSWWHIHVHATWGGEGVSV